ncbi:MAG: hypothetical protein ACRDH5_04335 [bacterium]
MAERRDQSEGGGEGRPRHRGPRGGTGTGRHSKVTKRSSLEHLFDIELRFRPGMAPVVSGEGRDGELVGSGDGTVSGPALRGTIRWSNFETAGETLCGMYPAGVIETEDGAEVWFDARGLALRSRGSSRWAVGGAISFRSEQSVLSDELSGLALWTGVFDTSSGRASWRVFRGSPGAFGRTI